MKNKILLFTLVVLLSSCQQKDRSGQSGEWIQLFNGKDLTDWQMKFAGYELNNNLHNTFRVEDGLLKVCYDEWDSLNGEFAHIFYKDKFSRYILRVEYR